MSTLEGPSRGPDGLDENNLPVELQTRNMVSPAYVITSTIQNGSVKTDPVVLASKVPSHDQPYVVITEQPQQRGFRFRYECEGPSHGGLQGTNSERSRKSFPSIKIVNYSGAARVVVSLVTDEKSPHSHAHKLLGTNCHNGLCTMEIQANLESITFPNLCVLHVTRKKLVDVLTERILDTIKLNKKLKENNMNFEPPITNEDHHTAKKQAEEQSKTMQLNVVRLCFQVFLRNPDGSFSKMLNPVVSQTIYDSKSPGASALKICRMDKYGGCCSGNEEVFLLCEKVQKDDIQVRFVEQNPDGSVKWEAYGNFGPLDVHRQYAIVFKTPAYYNTNIDKAVNVLIMLQRKTDQEVSEPKAFTYFPQNRDKDNIASKKRKRIPLDGYDIGDRGLGGAGMGGDVGGNTGLDGGSGAGDSGGSPSGGGMGTTSNSHIMVYQPAVNTENSAYGNVGIPRSVTEVIQVETRLEQEVLERQITVEALRQSAAHSSSWHDHEYLGQHLDSDIEVDAAVMSPVPEVKDFPHDNRFDVKAPESLEGFIVKSPYPGHSSDIPDLERGEFRKQSTDNKHNAEVSIDRLDSGVVPDATKSITSIDERLDTKEAITVKYANMTLSASSEEHKEEDVNMLATSDNHSEPDTKTDVVSEGVKSDEGFSETSEEAANRIVLLANKEKGSPLGCHPCQGLPSKHCSQLTDTARHVTGRVAERTLVALADYAETGDIRHLLLVQRHLITVSNENGDLPLHLAIINSQPQALRNLLDVTSTLPQQNRYINAFNLLRQTPLHLATVMQEDKMVEKLLHARADPTIADRNGNTSAHLAVTNHAAGCLRSLIKYLRPGTTRLDPFPELNYLNYDGYSPVHLAVLEGSVVMLQALVFGKADVCLPDGKSGKTALHHAVDNDDLPVAGYLLMEAHAYVDARTFDGNTALHIACARQMVGMVALLVTAGADVNCENEEIPDPETGTDEGGTVDRRGLRPIDYAKDNEEIIQILFGELSITSDKLTANVIEDRSNPGGKSMVTPHSLNELSRRLDPCHPGQDVIALADRLGYSSLAVALEDVRNKGSSATAFLLEYIEANEGNLDRLKDGLLALDRLDITSSLPQPV